MIQIPVIDQNDSLTEIDLEGETFFLHLGWNSEGEFWTLGVENVNRLTLVESICLVPDFPLLGRYRTNDMPPGDIVAIAPDRRNEISRSDLPDGIVALVYITAAEIALIVAEIRARLVNPVRPETPPRPDAAVWGAFLWASGARWS